MHSTPINRTAESEIAEAPYSKAREALWSYINTEFEVLLLESELDEIVRLASAIRDAETALPPNDKASDGQKGPNE